MVFKQLQPSAVAVVDVSGVEASWRDVPEAMIEAVDILTAAMAEGLDAHGGRRVEAVDADFCVGFADAHRALGWALALQAALAEADWPPALGDFSQAVAVGIDAGVLSRRTAAATGARLVTGEPVRAAAALASLAARRGVALSPAVDDLLTAQQIDALEAVRLRDERGRAVVVSRRFREEIDWPPSAASPDCGTLPRFSGAFIDRVREIGALAEHFGGSTRHVALSGSAGAGKTRLAVEFARLWRGRAGDEASALLCDLSEAEVVTEALFIVARNTGVQIPSSETVEALEHAVATALSRRGPALLILDDVDRVGDELDASIERWLADAANVCVITTRQRRPHPTVSTVTVEMLGLASARALLEDRLRHPIEMSAAPENTALLAAVVEQSGRLPLALELLAGAVRRDAVGASGTSAETSATAQSSLDEAMQRSWTMLAPLEQAALVACSVFTASFTEEAAVSVIERAVDAEVDSYELLTSLRQYSLLRSGGLRSGGLRSDGLRSDGQERLILLAPVRAFVAARAEDRVIERARRAFVGYFARWAGELRDALCADHEQVWIRRARVEFANLSRAADDALALDLPSCLTILEGLGELDMRIGPLGGLKERADDLVEAARGADERELLLRALRLRADRLVWTGQYRAAEQDYEEARALAEALGDTVVMASMLCGVGFSQGMRGLEEDALPKVRRAVDLVRDTDAYEAIAVYRSAAIIVRNRGEVDEALDYHHQALVRARRIDNAFTQASALFLLGSTLRRDQQWQGASRCLEEAGKLFSQIDDRRGRLVVFHELAECFNATEQVERAEECYTEAMQLATDIGDHEYSGLFWLGRGRSRFTRGDYERAESDLLEASIAVGQVGHVHLRIAAKMYLAATYASLERVAEARNYFEQVEEIFAETDVTRARPVFEVLHGYLDAARAHDAMRDGEPDAAKTSLRAAYERCEVGDTHHKTMPRETHREAKRLKAYLDRRVEAGELPAGASPSQRVIQICEDLRWFAVDAADPVDISRRGAIRRILRALAEKRLEAPGEPMDVHELLEAGWPDEDTVANSGQQRTYMAISRLRGLGLDGVLKTVEAGYLIDPEYTVLWAA